MQQIEAGNKNSNLEIKCLILIQNSPFPNTYFLSLAIIQSRSNSSQNDQSKSNLYWGFKEIYIALNYLEKSVIHILKYYVV